MHKYSDWRSVLHVCAHFEANKKAAATKDELCFLFHTLTQHVCMYMYLRIIIFSLIFCYPVNCQQGVIVPWASCLIFPLLQQHLEDRLGSASHQDFTRFPFKSTCSDGFSMWGQPSSLWVFHSWKRNVQHWSAISFFLLLAKRVCHFITTQEGAVTLKWRHDEQNC